MPEIPPEAVGVYLDTNVLIDFINSIGGWCPPAVRTRTDAQRVAAVRLYFYGYKPRNNWDLVVSGDGRRELTARGAPDWTISRFFDIDNASDAQAHEKVDALAAQFAAERGLRHADARHLASAHECYWVRCFVTNDDQLRSGAARLPLRHDLQVVDSLRAEEMLEIAVSEPPPIELLPSGQFAQSPSWLIPQGEEPINRP